MNRTIAAIAFAAATALSAVAVQAEEAANDSRDRLNALWEGPDFVTGSADGALIAAAARVSHGNQAGSTGGRNGALDGLIGGIGIGGADIGAIEGLTTPLPLRDVSK